MTAVIYFLPGLNWPGFPRLTRGLLSFASPKEE
jgi:hypothetical protein